MIPRAESLQTVMLMSSAFDLYKRFKVHNDSQNSTKSGLNQKLWNEHFAIEVLQAWERNFSEVSDLTKPAPSQYKSAYHLS